MPEVYTTYYHSPIGMLKISGTENYISEVSFYDKVQKTESKKKNLPPLIIQCVEQLIQYFQGARREFDLPIHQPGTKFQQSVWSEIITVPFGKTISYFELARKTGDTKAIRAVGSANGKNNVAGNWSVMPVEYGERNGYWSMKQNLRMGCRHYFRE